MYPKCDCGSDDERFPVYDARGIFLIYACDSCRDGKLGTYRPDVLEDPNYWADEPIEPEECF